MRRPSARRAKDPLGEVDGQGCGKDPRCRATVARPGGAPSSGRRAILTKPTLRSASGMSNPDAQNSEPSLRAGAALVPGAAVRESPSPLVGRGVEAVRLRREKHVGRSSRGFPALCSRTDARRPMFPARRDAVRIHGEDREVGRAFEDELQQLRIGWRPARTSGRRRRAWPPAISGELDPASGRLRTRWPRAPILAHRPQPNLLSRRFVPTRTIGAEIPSRFAEGLASPRSKKSGISPAAIQEPELQAIFVRGLAPDIAPNNASSILSKA